MSAPNRGEGHKRARAWERPYELVSEESPAAEGALRREQQSISIAAGFEVHGDAAAD